MTKDEAIDILYTQLTGLQCTGESDRHTNDVIDAIRMAIESLGTNVAYICDEDACVECGQEFIRDCYHTTDIHHAKNFEEVSPGVGVFFEKIINDKE